MKKIVTQLFNWLKSLSQTAIIVLGLLLIIIIGVIDYLITIDLALSIFYLIPITLLTWFVNTNVGIISSFVCSISWFLADLSVKKYPYIWLYPWNAGVRLGFYLITIYLLSELKIGYEREKKLARTDGLTGAINQRFFRHLLQGEIERSYRYKHPFTLVYFDVDNFKQVNDTLGHSKGDYLLKLITEIIQLNIRQTDSLSRLGGDEFALLLPETDYKSAQIVLQRIQKQLLEMVNLQQFPISFSMGAITYLTVPDSVDKALEQVDNLMYTVKKSGKNGLNHKIMNYEL